MFKKIRNFLFLVGCGVVPFISNFSCDTSGLSFSRYHQDNPDIIYIDDYPDVVYVDTCSCFYCCY